MLCAHHADLNMNICDHMCFRRNHCCNTHALGDYNAYSTALTVVQYILYMKGHRINI